MSGCQVRAPSYLEVLFGPRLKPTVEEDNWGNGGQIVGKVEGGRG